MAFGQMRGYAPHTWGVAPGYGDQWPSAKYADMHLTVAAFFPNLPPEGEIMSQIRDVVALVE